MERPACKTCPYWILRDEHDGEEKKTPGLIGCEISLKQYRRLYPDDEDGGTCQRFPRYEENKWPEDWCGEHPDFPAYIASLKA